MATLPTLILISALASSTTAPSGRLPFIADDFAGARAAAGRSGLPLFVEVGAPW